MDDKQSNAIRELLVRRTQDNIKSAKDARQWLIEEGLLDEHGDLSPQYGGEEN